MKVRIWGARGSVPAPLGPEIVKEKIIAAMLGVARLSNEQQREIIAAMQETPRLNPADEQPNHDQSVQAKRRRVIENYLTRLSPLASGTASGNTPCIEIRAGDELFIIDAGSGIRQLGRELMKGPCGRGEGVIHLFFSHPHWDHIQGFPFFRPAFIPGNKLYIYSMHDMELALRRQQEFISFPISLDYMQASKVFTRIEPEEVLTFDDLRIRSIRNHHPGDAYGFRFEKGNKAFVYASDSAYPDGMDIRPYLNFFTDADLLIFDAQFTQRESDEKEDWGHSSSFVGVEMAQQAKVKNLLLFHYDPTYSDQDLEKILEDTLKFQQNQYPTQPPVHVMIAQEGQTFDLTPPQTTQIQQVPGSRAAILKPTGIFDEHVAAELRDQLADMMKNEWPAQLIIDMSDVEMLQVAGLRALVKLRKEQQATPMALAGPSINVQQLIELAGYIDFFAIYPSVHVALNVLKARETLNLPGQILSQRYKIDRKVGDGRLGTVFQATDNQTGTAVAIKILSPSFSEAAIEQFLHQARQIVDLNHPNIVNVYDCDEDRGISFMAEEYLESRTLQDLLDAHPGQPLPFRAALSIAHSITHALEYAHSHGVIHGDLKPKNVLMADKVKISDFGLGRLEGGKALLNIDVPLALVTARYLAPEQILGHPTDARTDLYALGVILYELFTGRPIFEGSDQEILEHHRSGLPTSPRELNPKLSKPLEYLIFKLLDKDPNKRYASARQVRHILSNMSIPISRDRQDPAFTTERWPHLVGRKNLLQQLTHLWASTTQGHGQIVLVNGEPGVGKTRLIQELTGQLSEATVLIGECHDLEGSPAYQPFVSAINAYFNTVPFETAQNNVGQVWQTLVQMFPEIALLVPTITPPETLADVAPPTPLAAAVANITAQHPWLLIIDNAQWADTQSLRLLHYLARHCADMRLMIIAIVDPFDLHQNKGLADGLDQLSQQDNCTSLVVERLTEPEVNTLLQGIWSQEGIPTDLVSAIYNRTGGNPLFAETIAYGLVDEGVVNWQDRKWYFGPIVEVGLPQRDYEAITRRINHLNRETQTLLNQAAILGPAFHFKELQELSDLSEQNTLDSINLALERQFLKETSDENMLRFSHNKIQQVLYQRLSSLKQRLMHREAAEALERCYTANVTIVAERLAYHFFKADELNKALTYSIQAAARAKQLHAVQNGLHWVTFALNILDHLGPDNSSPAQRFDLLADRERLYNAYGNRPAQMNDLNQLQQLAQMLNNPAKQAVVHNRRAEYELTTQHPGEAATEAQAALITARQANDPALESESLIQLAAVALAQQQTEAAQQHLQTASILLINNDYPLMQASCFNSFGELYQQMNDNATSERYYNQALTLNQSCKNRAGQALNLSNLGQLLARQNNTDKAQMYQRQALTIAQTIGHQPLQARCWYQLALAYTSANMAKPAQGALNYAIAMHRTIEDEQGLAHDLELLHQLQTQ